MAHISTLPSSQPGAKPATRPVDQQAMAWARVVGVPYAVGEALFDLLRRVERLEAKEHK